ncbi:WXG100 family type VII secretion target [Mariniluteicoccus flavus]
MTANPIPEVKVGAATVTIPIYNDLSNACKHWTDGEASIGDVTAVGDIALGVLGVALDPLGALVGAAVGSLMDILVNNISWLKESMDFLLGNPDAIWAHAQKWESLSGEFAGVANTHAGTAGQLPTWKGPASDGYTQVLENVNQNFRAAHGAAKKMADWVSTAGTVVAIFRDTIWNLCKQFVTEVVTAAILAAAAAVPSVGASIAAFTGWFATKMAVIGAKVASKMAKLMRILSKLAKKMGMSSKLFDDAARALSKVSQNLLRTARQNIAAGRTRPATSGRHARPNDTIGLSPEMPGKTSAKDLFGERGADIYDQIKDTNKNVVKPIDKGQTKGTNEFDDEFDGKDPIRGIER